MVLEDDAGPESEARSLRPASGRSITRLTVNTYDKDLHDTLSNYFDVPLKERGRAWFAVGPDGVTYWRLSERVSHLPWEQMGQPTF